jgi:hypothetical protein
VATVAAVVAGAVVRRVVVAAAARGSDAPRTPSSRNKKSPGSPGLFLVKEENARSAVLTGTCWPASAIEGQSVGNFRN